MWGFSYHVLPLLIGFAESWGLKRDFGVDPKVQILVLQDLLTHSKLCDPGQIA